MIRTFRGFTLVEILVVVSVLAIVVSIVTVNFNHVRKVARDNKRAIDMQTIADGLKLFKAEKISYPHEGYEDTFNNPPKTNIPANCTGINPTEGLGENVSGIGTKWIANSGKSPTFFLRCLIDDGYLNDVPLDPINEFNNWPLNYATQSYYYISDYWGCACHNWQCPNNDSSKQGRAYLWYYPEIPATNRPPTGCGTFSLIQQAWNLGAVIKSLP